MYLTMERIEQLEREYGLPLYLFNQEEFIQNYRELEDSFQAIYPEFHICYSYKTNYTPAVCKLVKELGGYAEVVSDMEYELAERLGYTADHIVYNGPHKGALLESHILAGGINNIDHKEEAERVCHIAASHPECRIKTGIRVNFDIDAGYISRFGIEITQLGILISYLQEHGVEINGLHCHMSRARGIEAWGNRARTMLELVEQYDLQDIDYISLGSGMSGHMDEALKVQFPAAPSYKEYGDVAIQPFADFFQGKGKKPVLFTEPGTTLVSKYFDFLGKVEAIKEIRGQTFILCNCSFHNLGEICQMKNVPIRVFPAGGKAVKAENAKLVGYTCLEQDVLYRDFFGDIAVGDYIEFGNVGGYSVVDKPPFIQPNCAVVATEPDGVKLIKRKETWEDIFHTFTF